jgi:hypothetical protein
MKWKIEHGWRIDKHLQWSVHSVFVGTNSIQLENRRETNSSQNNLLMLQTDTAKTLVYSLRQWEGSSAYTPGQAYRALVAKVMHCRHKMQMGDQLYISAEFTAGERIHKTRREGSEIFQNRPECLLVKRMPLLNFHVVFYLLYKQTNKQIPWHESASELYQPSDRRLSAKLLPTFVDIECCVNTTDPYGRILDFLDRIYLLYTLLNCSALPILCVSTWKPIYFVSRQG